jgi:hypothetical protein
MSQAQPIIQFGDWGSGGEPPRSHRPTAISLWVSLGVVGLLAVPLYLGWLGVPVAIGGLAWLLVGARLAAKEKPTDHNPFPRPAHRWFSFHEGERSEPASPGIIRLGLRRRRLTTRASNPLTRSRS